MVCYPEPAHERMTTDCLQDEAAVPAKPVRVFKMAQLASQTVALPPQEQALALPV